MPFSEFTLCQCPGWVRATKWQFLELHGECPEASWAGTSLGSRPHAAKQGVRGAPCRPASPVDSPFSLRTASLGACVHVCRRGLNVGCCLCLRCFDQAANCRTHFRSRVP